MRHHAIAAAMGIVTAAVLAPSSQSLAASADPTGYWMKPDAERESKIQVFKCGKSKSLLCAKIAWLKDPKDSKGQPLHDVRNENPAQRGRSIVGLAIFTGMTPSAPSIWTGQIYNPEDGHTYSATLTVLSRKQILLRGCKAWLLCGEKQWLRTGAPPADVIPAVPAEGTEQIEASAEPATPPSRPDVKPAAAVAEASAAPAEIAAPAESQAMAEPLSAEASVQPVALVTPELAAPAPAPAELDARRGYGFLNVSNSSNTAELSGENVSSMFVMTEPLAAEAVTPDSGEQSVVTAAVQSAPPAAAPAPKPKATPAATAAAANPTPKTAATPKPAGQAAPAPKDAAAAPTGADSADALPAETAEAAMVEPVPLTRRQRRQLRKQQERQAEEFLPWLR